VAIAHGAWVYAILFAVIFPETGLIALPFLPGDSLLFMAGTILPGVIAWAWQRVSGPSPKQAPGGDNAS
jgi:membrane protein DedA with SNARE-associated domain